MWTDINMGRGAIVIGLAAIIIGEVLSEVIFPKGCSFYMRLFFVIVGGIVYYLIMIIVLWLSASCPGPLTFFITGWACLPQASKKTHSSCSTELHAAWNLYVRPSSTALPREWAVRVTQVHGWHQELLTTARVGLQGRPRGETSIYQVPSGLRISFI